MKNFASSHFRLAAASLETKLIYSLFLVFVAAGLVTMWTLQLHRIGFSYDRIVAYYLGGEIAGQIAFAKNFNVLLEETHFHSFIMGVTFLILSHLLNATLIPKSVRYLLILLVFFSSLFDIAGVWLVRYLSPLFAPLLMASWIGLWTGYLAMVVIPLYEMWLKPNSEFIS